MGRKFKGFKLPLSLSEKNNKIEQEKKSNKQKNIVQSIEKSGEDAFEGVLLSDNLDESLIILKKAFENCFDVIFREFTITEKQIRCCLIYIEVLIDNKQINNSILKNLITDLRLTNIDKNVSISNLIYTIKDNNISVGKVEAIKMLNDAIKYILNNNALLLVNGSVEGIAIEVKGWKTRQVSEAKVEPNILGSAEAFIEDVKVNISQVRRRIKTSDLKMKKFEVGKLSKTIVVVVYLNGIAEEKVINEICYRINKIDTNIIINEGNLEEYIQDNIYTPFPHMQKTERPDRVAVSLANGRVAIFTENSPFALIAPTTLAHMLMSMEENNTGTLFANFTRLLVYICLIITLFVPSLYVAITTFHQEMIPLPLLEVLAGARTTIPFPAILEALSMEMVFEILREASERLPKNIGQTLSIVGGLVIGQSAAQAGLISPVMIIVVALTAIASFAIPQYSFARAIRLLKFPIIILSGTIGIFGLIMSALTILIHLSTLKSFGVPYLAPIAPTNWMGLKTIVLKFPTSITNKMPPFLQKNKINSKKNSSY